MKKIEAVIFDLGGVLLNIDYNLTRNAFEKEGVTGFHEMYSQAAADKLFRNLEMGTITEDAFYKEFNLCTGLSFSNDQIAVAWNAMLLTFRESSLQFLNEIKTRYRLFLLSNTNEIHYNMFKRIYYESNRAHAFEDFFEKAYYSFEMGMRKPGLEIYEHVLVTNNLNAATTLFIDDSVQNVEGAKGLGLQAILLEEGMYVENLGL
ncbi:MAG: HAD family phosphatase [Bacteroidota bacterium]|nr:HAD family phosphatase [Bacteroidota bacterium]